MQNFLEWVNDDNLNNDYNCEEYIEGKLYLCDSFIDGDKIIFSAVCEYSHSYVNYDKDKPLGIIPLKNNEDTTQQKNHS